MVFPPKLRAVSYIFFIASLALMVFGIILALRVDSNRRAAESKKISLSATIFPLYDALSKIGGDRISASLILPAGASPHTFEPSADILKKNEAVKAVFKIGIIDDWADGIAASSGAVLYPVSDKIEMMPFNEGSEKGSPDPHYWLSFENAKIISENIAHELIRIDPEGKAYYENNLDRYLSLIDEMKTKTASVMSGVKGRKIASFHDAWGYFAKEEGIIISAVFEESPGVEPSAKDVRKFIDSAKNEGVKVFLIEPQFSSDSAEAVGSDAGLYLTTVDPEGTPNKFSSYPEMLYENAKKIEDALISAK